MSEVYLTPKEVADKLGYNHKSIQRYCRIKAIPCVRIQHSYRIPEKWVNQNIPQIEEMIQADKLEPESTIEPEIAVDEVKEDMPKKKTETNNTDIVTNKPKPKSFTPDPKKRLKKEVEDFEYADADDFDPDLDDPVDDSKPDSHPKGFLADYKGIGFYD